ncbi:MAG: type IV secretion system protein [Xanthomonadales bacterium]|nr:type IV secretion system protein [Xanthomonadales bacterium]
MGFVYFVLIYNWLSDRIDTFGMSLMATFMTWASAVALVFVTLWILTQGYRMITGQSRESMMALVLGMTRVAIIVSVATTMSIFGTSLLDLFSTELSTGINQMFTGDNSTAAQTIDDNLAWSQLALAAIDTVQTAPGDTETIAQKSHALLMAGLGTASPPMAAAAMLLLYKFALALFIGLGPLFILCLIFEQTRSLFQRWLLYGIGTLFSMAVLAFVSSLVLQLSLRVAAALWSANIVNAVTGLGAEGYSTQALQQGGVGLLLTVLIISVPPMAATFFQGTLGQFMYFSAFGGGAANRPGPQGQPPGSYADYNRTQSPASIATGSFGTASSNAVPGQMNHGMRGAIAPPASHPDAIKYRA